MTGIPNDALPPGATTEQWEKYDQGPLPRHEPFPDPHDAAIDNELCLAESLAEVKKNAYY